MWEVASRRMHYTDIFKLQKKKQLNAFFLYFGFILQLDWKLGFSIIRRLFQNKKNMKHPATGNKSGDRFFSATEITSVTFFYSLQSKHKSKQVCTICNKQNASRVPLPRNCSNDKSIHTKSLDLDLILKFPIKNITNWRWHRMINKHHRLFWYMNQILIICQLTPYNQ